MGWKKGWNVVKQSAGRGEEAGGTKIPAASIPNVVTSYTGSR